MYLNKITMVIPLPAKSSKTNHTNCITNINKAIKKVEKKGFKKLVNMYRCKTFNRVQYLFKK